MIISKLNDIYDNLEIISNLLYYKFRYMYISSFLRNSPSWRRAIEEWQSACLTQGVPQGWCLVLGWGEPPFFLEKKKSPLELDEGHSLAELAEANHPGHMAVTVQLAMKH